MEQIRRIGYNENLHPAIVPSADGMCLPSLSHHFDVPLIVRRRFVIGFAVTSQIPRIHHLNGETWETFKMATCQHLMLATAKLAIANSLSPFLRLTPCPIGVGCTLLTSTHNTCNVLRGHNVSLCHSVEHYEAKGVVFIGIILLFYIFAAKIQINCELTSKNDNISNE